MHPAEHRAETEPLIRLEFDGLTGPLALVVLQQFRKREKSFGPRQIEPIRELRRALSGPIAQMPRARQPVIFSSRDAARHHVERVLVDDVFSHLLRRLELREGVHVDGLFLRHGLAIRR